MALAAVHRVVERLGARWYLFGAQAVALHGAPRATKDIDVTVLLGEAKPADLLAAIRTAGFATLHNDARVFAASRVIPATHLASKVPIDFVLGGPGLEQHFSDHALQLRFGALTIPCSGSST